MAWVRELNVGQIDSGAVWSAPAGYETEIEAKLLWSDSIIWSGITWGTETKPSAGWVKEI